MIERRVGQRTLACLWLAAMAGPASGQGVIVDQSVMLSYGSGHWSGTPTASLTNVDGVGSALRETGWWYSVDDATREYAFGAPQEEIYADGSLAADWFPSLVSPFGAVEQTWVLDNEGPSGGFISTMEVTNYTNLPHTFTLYHYVDMRLAGTLSGDSGVSVNNHTLEFTDGTSRAIYKAVQPTHYEVGAYPSLRAKLNDTQATTLGDSGVPFGPGDATAAYQFGPVTLAPQGSIKASVALYVNPTSRHVKGDVWGVLGSPPLFGRFQLLFVDIPKAAWMRRSALLASYTDFMDVPAGYEMAGVDDFDGDGLSEFALRGGTSGVTTIGGQQITGAPILPLNWKLSATGDFDADGKADILWRNTTSQKLVVWTMNGNAKTGGIIPAPDQAVDNNWEVVGAADFNGDGQRDLLWYNQTSGKLVLWYMDENVQRITGGFTTPAAVGDNNWRAVAVGDYGRGPGGLHGTQDIVWQNDTSGRIVVWNMDLNGTRTGGGFTTPDSLGTGVKVVGPR